MVARDALQPDEILEAGELVEGPTDVVGGKEEEAPAGERAFEAKTRLNKYGPPSEWNPERGRKIVQFVRAGNYLGVAAAASGVNRRTLWKWLKDGQRRVTPELAAWAEEVDAAQAQAHAEGVMMIRKAAQENWPAMAWWLERKYPEEWARQDRVDVNVTMRAMVEKVSIELGVSAEELFAEAQKALKSLD